MYNKTQQINKLDEGNIVSDIFVIKNKKGFQTYSDERHRIDLRIADSSANIDLKIWSTGNLEEFEKFYEKINIDQVLFLQGKVNSFNNQLEISSNFGFNEIKILNEGEFEPGVFIAKSDNNIEFMFNEFMISVYSIENEELKKLLISIFSDEKITDKFKICPASVYRHGAYIGGLLEHCLEIIKICEAYCSVYPSLNRDLLISGILIHDIGKIRLFELGNGISYSKEGELIGHIMLGWEIISSKFDDVEVSVDSKNKLKHMLLSSPGKIEYGAVKKPAFPEALIIAMVKESCAKTNQMNKLIRDVDGEFSFNKDFGKIYSR